MRAPDPLDHASSRPLLLADEIEELARGRLMALASDFDGTLSDLVGVPEEATLRDDARQALAELANTCSILVVSGRSLDDLQKHLGLDGILIAGEHGGDLLLPSGVRLQENLTLATATALEGFGELGEEILAGTPGHVERKRLATAAHTRRIVDGRRPDVERALATAAIGLARAGVVEAIVGKRVIELRACGATKALAFARFAGAAPPDAFFVALGDDATDEDVFARVNALGGVTIRVGSGWSSARRRLAGPAEVAELLAALARRRGAPLARSATGGL